MTAERARQLGRALAERSCRQQGVELHITDQGVLLLLARLVLGLDREPGAGGEAGDRAA